MSTHASEPVSRSIIESTPWRVDPDQSSVEFHVKTFWGLMTVNGRFSRYHGTLDLSAHPVIELTTEADSVDTANEKRDAHLRSADFFDAEKHPYIRFVSDSAELDGNRLHIRGRLHARGHSVPLELAATLRPIGDDLEFEAATAADHRQLGMTWNPARMIRPSSELTISARLVRDVV